MASTIKTVTGHSTGRSPGAKRGVVWGLALGVLAGGLWFFLLRGGEPPRSINLPEPGEITNGMEEVTDGAADAVAGTKRAKAPVETFKVFAPKDPFDPLVEPKTESAAGNAKASAGTRSTTEGDASLAGDHSVHLIEIVGAASAVIAVDGMEYEVALGESFADSFQLVTLSGKCASVLYGDEQLTLC